ncbi:MAG: hypothetical protein SFY66_09970 [Oculatellaceae cyanobacterium bins.114]|nr:hypothetical protein [Oculatellaceae cyanobacterium bins.114]
MSKTQAVELLNTLLKLNCLEIKDWLRQVWKETEQIPTEFHWLGLAEAIAFKARNEINSDMGESNLICAEVATSIYDFLAECEIDSAIKESLLNSSMMLRTYMIRKFGVIPNDPVLDPEVINNWFFNHSEQYESVQKQILKWKESVLLSPRNNDLAKIFDEFPIENIQRLRCIKTRLRVLKYLYEDEHLKPSEEISKWLAIHQDLP